MERQLKGIDIIGWAIIGSTLVNVFNFLLPLYIHIAALMINVFPLKIYNWLSRWFQIERFVIIIVACGLIVIGIALLKRRNVARKAVIGLSALRVIAQFTHLFFMPKTGSRWYVNVIVVILVQGIFIYYLTRPKVKEMFR